MKSIALFDFDGTITHRDTLLPFLFFTTHPLVAVWKLLCSVPALTKWWFGWLSRQEAKESVLSRFYAGRSIVELKKLGREFAAQKLKKKVKPEMVRMIKAHQSERHLCFLVSASIDVYLEPWAEKMGFERCLCSRLAVTNKGIVTGKLQGKNCWGPEKRARVVEVLGDPRNYTIYAYGDSRGDKEMLEMRSDGAPDGSGGSCACD